MPVQSQVNQTTRLALSHFRLLPMSLAKDMNRRLKRDRESDSESGDPIKRTKTENEETPSTGELPPLASQVPKDNKVSMCVPCSSISKPRAACAWAFCHTTQNI
jgi:hypothetical protein